jgi:hypothetical protein
MAAVSLTVTGVTRTQGGGFLIECLDERGVTESVEYVSRREARNSLHSFLDDESVKMLIRAAVTARGLRLTQDGDNADDLDSLVGKVFTFNIRAQQNLLKVI